MFERPADRYPDVVKVGVEGLGPFHFVRTAQTLSGPFDEVGVVSGVAGGQLIGDPSSGDVIRAIVAHGLKQPISGHAAGIELLDHGLVYQCGEDIEHIKVIRVEFGGHRDSPGQVEATGKDRQAIEEVLFVGGEELVTPVKRGP